MYTESRQPVFREITPRDAEGFLALNNFPGQRAYKPMKGRSYADNMANGSHRRIEIAVAKVRESGVDYLMNGQHNCNAILIHNRPYSGVVSYYTCDTMEDAWRLFATFDVHASRTEQQFMHSRRGLFDDERLHDVPLRVLQCCGTALYALGAGTDPQFNAPATHVKTEKADLVDKYADDVIFVSQYKEYGHMIAVGCVAAIIATERKNKKAAAEFWEKVGTGEMLVLSDPRRRLRDSLMDLRFLGEIRGGYQRQKAMFALCASWWNSWRTGEVRRSVKVNAMSGVPKVSA
jgi:hypothetical protein